MPLYVNNLFKYTIYVRTKKGVKLFKGIIMYIYHVGSMPSLSVYNSQFYHDVMSYNRIPIHYHYESSYHNCIRCNRVPYINHAFSWAKGKFIKDSNLKMSHTVIVHESYYRTVVQLV